MAYFRHSESWFRPGFGGCYFVLLKATLKLRFCYFSLFLHLLAESYFFCNCCLFFLEGFRCGPTVACQCSFWPRVCSECCLSVFVLAGVWAVGGCYHMRRFPARLGDWGLVRWCGGISCTIVHQACALRFAGAVRVVTSTGGHMLLHEPILEVRFRYLVLAKTTLWDYCSVTFWKCEKASFRFFFATLIFFARWARPHNTTSAYFRRSSRHRRSKNE